MPLGPICVLDVEVLHHRVDDPLIGARFCSGVRPAAATR
jgi:hypothetical protein